MQGKKMEFMIEPRFKHMFEMVENMNEFEVLDYKPQQIIIDFVNDFWLKKFNKKDLLGAEIRIIENKAKDVFKKSFPNRDKKTAQHFADDTIFQLAFKLTRQGEERDFV